MKTTLIQLVFVLVLNLGCMEASFELDQIFEGCYNASYQSEGFDIKASIDAYEKVLITKGVLKNGSGDSYLDVFKKLVTTTDVQINAPSFQSSSPWKKLDKTVIVAMFECEREMLELAKEKDPKWQYLITLFESPEANENPEVLYQTMKKKLSEKDLNSYYFKYKMFTLLDLANKQG